MLSDSSLRCIKKEIIGGELYSYRINHSNKSELQCEVELIRKKERHNLNVIRVRVQDNLRS